MVCFILGMMVSNSHCHIVVIYCLNGKLDELEPVVSSCYEFSCRQASMQQNALLYFPRGYK